MSDATVSQPPSPPPFPHLLTCPHWLPRAEDVLLLSRCLTRLHTLEVDLDTSQAEVVAFAHALGGFPALHTLVLHVQTTVRPRYGDDDDEGVGGFVRPSPPSEDSDLDFCLRLFGLLLAARRGRSIGKDSRSDRRAVEVESWRSITVNVGGWREVPGAPPIRGVEADERARRLCRAVASCWSGAAARQASPARGVAVEVEGMRGMWLREEKCRECLLGSGPALDGVGSMVPRAGAELGVLDGENDDLEEEADEFAEGAYTY